MRGFRQSALALVLFIRFAGSAAAEGPGQGPPSMGQVATRSGAPNYHTTAFRFYNARSMHVARDDIASLRIGLPNWYVAAADTAVASHKHDGTESALGPSAATVGCSVEYPIGVIDGLCRWKGSPVGAIAPGETGFSDAVVLARPIPSGAVFAVRQTYANPDGLPFHSNNLQATPGDGMEFSATPLPDKVGTVAPIKQAVSNEAVAFPAAIIAMTRQPSVCIAGDSRASGILTGSNPAGDSGELAMTVGAKMAYINLAVSSDLALRAAANYRNRLALTAYCSRIISEYGANDILNGRTAGQTLAAIKVFVAILPATKPIWEATLAPLTTSTDRWATTGNQALVSSASNATRIAVNDAIRASQIPGVKGVIDIADVVESARNSGVWKGGWSADGLHENYAGAVAIQASGVVNGALRGR